MIRLVICLFGLSFLPGITMAQKYVVELERVAFDRDLTDAEAQQIGESFQNPGAQVRTFAQERLRILRQRAKTKTSLKSTMLVGTSETQSQRVETDSFVMQAHIRVIEANDLSCKLDVQAGLALVTGASSCHSEERSILLDDEHPVSSFSSGDLHWHFIIRVREATGYDLAPKKIPKNFGDEIYDKKWRKSTAKNRLTCIENQLVDETT